jgi:nitroreductase
MQLKEAVYNRESVRIFSPKGVDWLKIMRAIDYARFAPSAGNNFITKFILVSDKNKIQILAEACQQEFISQVKYVVVVLSDENVLTRTFEKRGKRYAPLQTGAAIENFLLGLTEQKLDTVWVGHFYEEQIYRELGVPEKMKIEAVFPIGKKAKIITKPNLKKDLDEILYYDKWGNNKIIPIKKVSSEAS